jgi:CRISPR/Cas system-associated protein Cas10 (large subunit of type III CRISPR-Cas system)
MEIFFDIKSVDPFMFLVLIGLADATILELHSQFNTLMTLFFAAFITNAAANIIERIAAPANSGVKVTPINPKLFMMG